MAHDITEFCCETGASCLDGSNLKNYCNNCGAECDGCEFNGQTPQQIFKKPEIVCPSCGKTSDILILDHHGKKMCLHCYAMAPVTIVPEDF